MHFYYEWAGVNTLTVGWYLFKVEDEFIFIVFLGTSSPKSAFNNLPISCGTILIDFYLKLWILLL